MENLVAPLHVVNDDSSSDESRMQRCTETARNYFRNRLPIFKWFPGYKWSDVIPDAVAGFTVGSLVYSVGN